jgi:hypothetical protein
MVFPHEREGLDRGEWDCASKLVRNNSSGQQHEIDSPHLCCDSVCYADAGG